MPKENKKPKIEKPKPIFSRGPMKFPKVEVTGILFSPEALVMLSFAIIIDLIGFALFCFALDDFWILDIIGLFVIGTWMIFRTGNITATRALKKKVGGKIGKKIFKRLGLTFLTEITPWVGGLIPAWTLAVYFELKNNPL